ncbi:uncharacterized protein [Leptinotarsa decemlineata]|uniref:uncharacterized protein n=1 Tax=Leptinotarsa decemlineata TaxID=7539 RepID=UPI003D307212
MKGILYYNCNRSGKYQIKGQERKRAIKSQGSCKVGHMCTSQIIVVKNGNDIYQVTYYSTHYGHDTEVQHVRMTKDEREKIASKLAEGVTNSKILDSSRSQFHENSLTRLNLLTRNDINNIKYSFKINTQKTIPHRRASISDLWNDEWEVDENQQILMLKRQGEEHHQLEKDDFCLIFMNCSQQHMLKKFGSIQP